MKDQITIFDELYPKYKITKPIRLIEMFSGYGSQALALKYLGVEFEHWKICEWAIKSIQAYKDIHFTDDNIDYSSGYSKKALIDWLYSKGISQNYNEPMTKEQISRLNENSLRNIFNNIICTNNLVNIQQVKGKDLEIVDTDKYNYIFCYSFPCQDLSIAGKRNGMSDTSTRSGMLWEVERILTECNQLGTMPQVLLMENVPQVHGIDNVQDFNKWQLRLEELGYKNYFQDLIATDFGIPQTRNRCFMISILGDYSYTFPKSIPLKLRLKDMLEDNVNEKYYLSSKMLKCIESRMPSGESHITTGINIGNRNTMQKAGTITTKAGSRATDNYVIENEEYDYSKKDGKIMKTKLCNELIKQGKVKENDVIRHSYTTSRTNDWDKRSIEKNNLSPTLDTRCDCLGVCVGTYQYAKSDKFMHNKDRLQLGKETSDTLQTTPKKGVVINPLKGKSGKSWQFEQQVYDENGSARTLKASDGSGNIPKVINDLRIRKLTPKECFRLQGVKDEDFENCAKNQSDSSLYHLAGDSIVVDVLCHIFKELL